MDRTWITSARRFSAAYVEGVENFMNFIRAEYGGPKSDVLCPCSSCMNSVTRPPVNFAKSSTLVWDVGHIY